VARVESFAPERSNDDDDHYDDVDDDDDERTFNKYINHD